MTDRISLLTEDERQRLSLPERIDVGSYHTGNPLRECPFVIDLDARPLATLAEEAARGCRVYEFMSIRRPGDVLHYLWVRFMDVDRDVVDAIADRPTRQWYVTDPQAVRYLPAVPFVEFDGCFRWDGDDTRDDARAWLQHRGCSYWPARQTRLLELVRSLQARLRERDDYLLRHELRLIDARRHRRDFLPEVTCSPLLKSAVPESPPVPPPVFEAIVDLIRHDDVHSVSCPFTNYALWRLLVEEQVRRAEATGRPPQEAFCLCGPDSGLPGVEAEDWGGEVHIPYESACGADLFILPSWHRFFADKVRDGGKLRYAVGKPCHHVLLQDDHGELACATRKAVGDWTLYTSTAPYEDCKPFMARY